MVICDSCKSKLGASVEEFDGYECEECGGEYCNKCCVEYDSGTFCKAHAPSCTSCKIKLMGEAFTCSDCCDDLCEKCVISAEGDDFCNACAPKCKECKQALSTYEMCEQCEEVICKTCSVKTKCTADIGEKPTTVILCKTHGAEFNERTTENKIVIDYVTKLLKELRLQPTAINKNFSLDEDEFIAQFEIKNGWVVDLSLPKVGRLSIDIEAEDFSTTISTTTYSHETALADIRNGIMKVAKKEQLALAKAFKERRDNFLDGLALCDSPNLQAEGKKMITKIEEMLKKAYNGIQD